MNNPTRSPGDVLIDSVKGTIADIKKRKSMGSVSCSSCSKDITVQNIIPGDTYNDGIDCDFYAQCPCGLKKMPFDVRKKSHSSFVPKTSSSGGRKPLYGPDYDELEGP